MNRYNVTISRSEGAPHCSDTESETLGADSPWPDCGQRSTPVVQHERPRSEFDEVDLVERADDRCLVRFEQRQQRGVRDVARRDNQQPSWRPG